MLMPSIRKEAESERAPELLMLNDPKALAAVFPFRLLVEPITDPGTSTARSRKNRPFNGISEIVFDPMTSPIELDSVSTALTPAAVTSTLVAAPLTDKTTSARP